MCLVNLNEYGLKYSLLAWFKNLQWKMAGIPVMEYRPRISGIKWVWADRGGPQRVM